MSKKTQPVIVNWDTTCSPNCQITAYNGALVKNGPVSVPNDGAIMFFNGLGKDTPITVRFYANSQQKALGAAYSDFCVGQTSPEYNVTNLSDCSINKPDGEYVYSVQAEGYRTLDPVIIIEPGLNYMKPDVYKESWGTPAIVSMVILAAVVSFAVGRYLSR